MISKLNEKGYFLVESVTALSIVSLMLLVYAPFLDDMIQKLEMEKREVEMCRLLYDEAREGEGNSLGTVYSGNWAFQKTVQLSAPKKGIRVEHGETNTHKRIQVMSVQWE